MEEWFTLKKAIIGTVAIMVLGGIINKAKWLKVLNKIEKHKERTSRSRKFCSENKVTRRWLPDTPSFPERYLLWFSRACILGAVISLATLTFGKVLDNDEWYLVLSSQDGRIFDDIPNNPPLFNLLAFMVQQVMPLRAFLLLPVLFTAGFLVVLEIIARKRGANPFVMTAVVLAIAAPQAEILAYYRAYSLLLLFLALLFLAWQEGNEGLFLISVAGAAYTHHLGLFVATGVLGLRFLFKERAPWVNLAILLPGYGMVYSGFAAKHGSQGSWGLRAENLFTWKVLMGSVLVFGGAVMARKFFGKKLLGFSVVLAMVPAVLLTLIPVREQYFLPLILAAALLFSTALQNLANETGGQWGCNLICVGVLVFMAGESSFLWLAVGAVGVLAVIQTAVPAKSPEIGKAGAAVIAVFLLWGTLLAGNHLKELFQTQAHEFGVMQRTLKEVKESCGTVAVYHNALLGTVLYALEGYPFPPLRPLGGSAWLAGSYRGDAPLRDLTWSAFLLSTSHYRFTSECGNLDFLPLREKALPVENPAVWVLADGYEPFVKAPGKGTLVARLPGFQVFLPNQGQAPTTNASP